jgi:hypothetical protein
VHLVLLNGLRLLLRVHLVLLNGLRLLLRVHLILLIRIRLLLRVHLILLIRIRLLLSVFLFLLSLKTQLPLGSIFDVLTVNFSMMGCLGLCYGLRSRYRRCFPVVIPSLTRRWGWWAVACLMRRWTTELLGWRTELSLGSWLLELRWGRRAADEVGLLDWEDLRWWELLWSGSGVLRTMG